jgi:hypothetical protein
VVIATAVAVALAAPVLTVVLIAGAPHAAVPLLRLYNATAAASSTTFSGVIAGTGYFLSSFFSSGFLAVASLSLLCAASAASMRGSLASTPGSWPSSWFTKLFKCVCVQQKQLNKQYSNGQ